MDQVSRYRTKYPPKEHEEAVRMLLEGIGKQSLRDTCDGESVKNWHAYDDRQSSISIGTDSSELLSSTMRVPSMRSKATITSDSVSGSSVEHDSMFKEPIPSRTIAVQCDLKSSSMKHDSRFDGSMQASSISSTRYGFYDYTPETLETRRKLQQSDQINQMKLEHYADRHRGVDENFNSTHELPYYPKPPAQNDDASLDRGFLSNSGQIIDHSKPEYVIDNRLASMSLSRRPKLLERPIGDSYRDNTQTSGYCTSSRRIKSLSRDHLAQPYKTQLMRQTDRLLNNEHKSRNSSCSNVEVNRSKSMRQIGMGHRDYDTRDHNESNEDSESSVTRTWANPNFNSAAQLGDDITKPNNRKSSRSYSMREVNSTPIPRSHSKRYREEDFESESESSSLEAIQRFVGSHPLDYDSQYRLNESGLPELNTFDPQSYLTKDSNSFTGLNGSYEKSAPIAGRAMSQQSLARPTMPPVYGRRRACSNSGSDVGGSSMSLVSRLHGRYENAHTRTPVVMYIPKAAPRHNLSADGINSRSYTLRKSSRLKQKSSFLDRKRSLSRNGSDSESSSMLRTLVKPKVKPNLTSKRGSRLHGSSLNQNDDEEDLDGVGRLASEVDSYKFRRRYSVPKDAKINWFAKLRQRVTPKI